MKFIMKKNIFALIAACGLAGCATNLGELRGAQLAMDDFSSILAGEYLSYSESEYEQGRWDAAEYFAGKGLASLKGEKVLPDAGSNQMLGEARAELLAVLTDDIKKTTALAAPAQVLFDCWNAEVARSVLPAAGGCGEEFLSTFDELQKLADERTYGANGKKTVIFQPNNAEITDEAKGQISDFVKRIAKKKNFSKNFSLQLSAHHNAEAELAVARLVAVKNELVSAGIKIEKIYIKKSAGKKAVYLSSDEEMQDNDEIDIAVVTQHKFKHKK